MKRTDTDRAARLPLALIVLIAGVALGALAVFSAGGPGAGAALAEHPWTVVTVLALTVVLQALSLRGFATSISVAGIGMMAAGFSVGMGVAGVAALLAALVHVVKKRPKPHRAVFNAATFVLATAASTGAYWALDGPSSHGFRQFLAAQVAACAFLVVNAGLLTLAMAAAEHREPVAVWKERLAWLTPHYLCFGPLALAAAVTDEELGAVGLLAGATLSVLLTVLLRQSVTRIRARRSSRARAAQAGT